MAIINKSLISLFTKLGLGQPLNSKNQIVLGLGQIVDAIGHSRANFNRNSLVYQVFSTKAAEKDANVIDQIFPDVEGTPASIPAGFYSRSKNKYHKKSKNSKNVVKDVNKEGRLIIECKNEEFDHFSGQTYSKFDLVPLASKGWFNKKSKGDYFKINCYPDREQRENVFWAKETDSFSGLGLDDDVVNALTKMGITRPTHIQAFGIPKVLRNQNVLLAGETGCGKTLAFLLPVVQEILHWRKIAPERKLNMPLALILVPGKELTYQIADVADQLAKELMFDLDVAVGGHTKRLMTHPNFKPVDLFVASIGAASKLTTSGVYNMSCVRHIVLDEADTTLDDSFNEHIVRYLKKFPISYGKSRTSPNVLPKFCQLTLCSATIPTSMASILGDIMNPESLVRVETPRLHKVLIHVPQVFYRLGQSQKPAKLLEIVKKNMANDIPTIVFSNRSKVSDWVSMFLNENGISCINLNGDMPVDVRSGRFDQFQRGFVDIISCTDVASRGLDTVRAKHIINYDFPMYMADYIHRCGRVGRVGHIEERNISNFVTGPLEIELVQKIETAVRTMADLPNVNANITRVLHHRIMRNKDG